MAKRKAVTPPSETTPPSPAKEYTVLARRYRPQQFADLVGQEPVARALSNALQSNRVAHAYLFTGARGVGKTSTARILAKALNCEKGPTPTPCGVCDICQSIASGEDVDVLEIDGASNRGINEVREIRANVQYRPSRSRYKIYIIDEVHMLTKEAFNALLKTLEEPPPHVKFIFATTEVQKIPVTILSRCQRFDFAGIGTARIVERLREIVAGENMQADDAALELVARRAGGSMRDAQSLLDQLLAFGGTRLTAEQVHKLLGTASEERVADLASAVLAHEPQRALQLLGQTLEEGLQCNELLDQLIDYWRDLMVVSCAGEEGQELSRSGAHRDKLGQQARTLPLDTILAGLDVLVSTKSRLRTTNHGRVLLEMALVRLARLDDLVSLSQLAQWLANGSRAAPTPTVPASGARPTTTGARPALPTLPPESVKKNSVSGAETAGEPSVIPLTKETLTQVWQEVLAQVGPMLASDLVRSEVVAISGPNTLVLRFPLRYNLQREHCQEPAKVARVEEVLRKITGQSWRLRIESSNGIAERGAAPAPRVGDTENSQLRSQRQRAEILQQPLLKRAMDLLGAQIVRLDEGFGAAPSDRTPRESEEV
jgi:DNA polymerase-3 subunit gamma/tau